MPSWESPPCWISRHPAEFRDALGASGLPPSTALVELETAIGRTSRAPSAFPLHDFVGISSPAGASPRLQVKVKAACLGKCFHGPARHFGQKKSRVGEGLARPSPRRVAQWLPPRPSRYRVHQFQCPRLGPVPGQTSTAVIWLLQDHKAALECPLNSHARARGQLRVMHRQHPVPCHPIWLTPSGQHQLELTASHSCARWSKLSQLLAATMLRCARRFRRSSTHRLSRQFQQPSAWPRSPKTPPRFLSHVNRRCHAGAQVPLKPEASADAGKERSHGSQECFSRRCRACGRL